MRCLFSTTHFVYLFIPAIAVVELFDSAAGVHELLLTREEGVALIADINGDDISLLRSAGLKGITASANDFYSSVLGMDRFFHDEVPRNL